MPDGEDIVKRLRDLAFATSGEGPVYEAMRESANEIEALRRDVVKLGKGFQLFVVGEMTKHGLSDKGMKEVVDAFMSVFPGGVEDPRLAVARPTKSDPRVAAAVAKGLLPAVREWMDACGVDSDQVEPELVTALRGCNLDGYALARELERQGWDVDEDLVDTLSMASHYADLAHRDLVEEWVRTYAIAPKIQLGAKVTFGGAEAEVVGINANRAEYTVYVESMGHVRDGLGTHGIILPFEKLEAEAA